MPVCPMRKAVFPHDLQNPKRANTTQRRRADGDREPWASRTFFSSASRRRSHALARALSHSDALCAASLVARYLTSRPSRVATARPAFASNCRCFTMAWRDTLAPSASSVAVRPSGFSRSCSKSRRRVLSDSAAKTTETSSFIEGRDSPALSSQSVIPILRSAFLRRWV